MLISRCAWHRRYHGYTKILGISSWRGLQPSFTDGICHKCAARVRADHLRSRFDRGASADRRETAWMPGLIAVSLSIVIALVLVARPTHELPPLPPVVAVLPPAPAEAPRIEVAPVEAARGDAEASGATPEPLFVQRPAASPRKVKWVSATAGPSRVHRAVLGRSRHAWAEPSALSRAAMPVAWAPSRTLVPRDTTQSP